MMKLRDFKNKPEQYKEIKEICKEYGVSPDDEVDINDLLSIINAKNNPIKAINVRAKMIANAINDKRMGR